MQLRSAPSGAQCASSASQGHQAHHAVRPSRLYHQQQQQDSSSRSGVACKSMSGRGGRGGGGRDRSPDFGDGLLIGVGGPGRQGGPNNKGTPPSAPAKLVLPGRSAPSTSGGGNPRLIIPAKGMEKILAQGAEALGPEVMTVTGPNRYRPPAGFMNDDGPDDVSQFSSMPPDVMISKLRSRAGKWHQLAKMLPILAQAGYDSNSVDDVAGITPVLQNRWMVAATVYDSLVASGLLSSERLGRFDQRGDELLYSFRFLNQDMRVEAAQYILDQNLDAPACEVLARAMKEWERRPMERAGFSNLPGDCMAFKYMRDALECRRLEDAEVKMEQALNTAVTDSARERVFEMLTLLRNEQTGGVVGGVGDSSISGLATLTVLRLDPDELGFRPLPVLGALGQVGASELELAPRTSQEGAFGAFNIDNQAAKCTWVALPQWKALAMMRYPVALSIADCSTVPAILAGAKAKTEEDRKRLAGAGLVVADKCETHPDKVDPGSYYLAATGGPGTNAKLALVEGAKVKERGLRAVATVSFVARPPAREQVTVSESGLLQL